MNRPEVASDLPTVTRACLPFGIRSIRPVRVSIAAQLLKLSRKTVEAWAREGLLTEASGRHRRLLPALQRLHEVLHLMRDLRANGRDRNLIEAVRCCSADTRQRGTNRCRNALSSAGRGSAGLRRSSWRTGAGCRCTRSGRPPHGLGATIPATDPRGVPTVMRVSGARLPEADMRKATRPALHADTDRLSLTWSCGDLNPRPPRCERGALPDCAIAPTRRNTSTVRPHAPNRGREPPAHRDPSPVFATSTVGRNVFTTAIE